MKNSAKKFAIIGIAIISFSCNNGGETQKADNQDTVRSETPPNEQPNSTGKFDINSIPVSDKDLGDFPFFSFPEGLVALNKPIERKFDKLYFAIDGVMTPLEGKVWKTGVWTKSNQSNDWSVAFFEKSYDEAIKAIGGVKIFDGTITNEEYEKYHPQATYLGEDGSIGYAGENIKTYVIRRADGGDVYIQLSATSGVGKINILQKEGFKQTISMLKADQIQKDLNDKGKAVLHINFDTDKATLKADGKEAVAEITKALNTDKMLKISINGYTDNTGDEKHNLDLSKQRAETVKKELIKSGIDVNRLSSEGFGQNNPIADNNTEEGKSQNRRVELIKNNRGH